MNQSPKQKPNPNRSCSRKFILPLFGILIVASAMLVQITNIGSGLPASPAGGYPEPKVSTIYHIFPIKTAQAASSFESATAKTGSGASLFGSIIGKMQGWFSGFKGKLFSGSSTPAPSQTGSPVPQIQVQKGTTQKLNPVPQLGTTQQPPQTAGGDQYGSNGTQKNPYILEPNQFKKICGKNEYVLWWSKRGSDGKDLKEVADKMENSYLLLPSCQALARCHCCCNTCTFVPPPCPPDICFSNMSICDGTPVCSPKCVCGMCIGECQGFKNPFHPKAFDTDCSCQQTGCPDGSGCKIILYEANFQWHWGVYGANGALEEHVTNTKGGAYYMDNAAPHVFETKSPDSAKGKGGWVDKLAQDNGKCCKCTTSGPAASGSHEEVDIKKYVESIRPGGVGPKADPKKSSLPGIPGSGQ